MSKIFITGAAGFIGSHLWDYMEQRGHNVAGIDNFSHASKHPKNNRVQYADIRYYHDIESYVRDCDVVFHLAAQIHVDKSISNVDETLDVNIQGTANVLEAVKKFDKQMVFASSSEVYGTAQVDKIDERHQLDSQSPYAASKVAGDRLCKAYFDTYGTKVAILRNFNTFGEYQNDTSYGGVIAIFTKAALEGRPLYIFGDGEQSRDYMHVSDAIRGYEFCIENKLFGTPINIGTGDTVTINELAQLIVEYAESKSEIIYTNARAGEVMRLCADMTKAKNFGFEIKTNFKNNLKDYVEWYKKSYYR